jgi:DNA invertase Pin-like site-specific DNA recombinase
MDGRFIAYYRVPTAKQGRSGLGLEGQQAGVRGYLNGGNWYLVSEFVEVESGKQNDRPELQKGLDLCCLTGSVLVIAKLDRLSRDAHFLQGLEKAGVEFVAVDMPGANRLTVRLMAVIAQEEREMISQRTKAALQAAKARGVKLGKNNITTEIQAKGAEAGAVAVKSQANAFASRVLPTIQCLQAQGLSLNAIAKKLGGQGIMTARGGAWSAQAVKNVLARVG